METEMSHRQLFSIPPAPPVGEDVDTGVLAARWQNEGDERARDTVIARYLPMARRLARRYHTSLEPFDDLFQVASLGLVAAINRFDPSRGCSFPSYAIPTILGELKRHFRNTGWAVHVPRRGQEMALRVERAGREIFDKWGREPTIIELAQYLEVSPEDVLDGLEAATGHYAASLDEPIKGSEPEDPDCLIDRIGHHDDGYQTVETTLSFAEAIKRLPFVERQALELRLSRSMKQMDIADELGCSQMQVSRLLRRAGATVSEAMRPAI
jgi:RNA polymerase sigma-B factor